MAQFAIEIDDADVGRVLTAIAANYSRPAQVPNPDFDPDAEVLVDEMIDNPETMAQFANRIVRQFLSEHVAAYELNAARQAAVDAANTSVNINDPAL
tara:strand:- start:11061 stop:11351 length:291 start_codon:yes stop_codon:yes gene_type:complete